jgi:hypothetical protein
MLLILSVLVVINLVIYLTRAHASREPRVPAWPWLALARCETGVNWKHYTYSYEGAYGMTHAAWDQFRLPSMPSGAHLATPWQQTLVAMRILRRVGWGAWPVCSYRIGAR